MEGRSNLKASLLVVDPGYDRRVVARIVEQVPDEHVQGGQGQLGGVLPGPPSLPLNTAGGRSGLRTVRALAGRWR